MEWCAVAYWQQLQISGSSQEFSALWVIHKACMKLCFSLWNVFLPYMNKQWDFFSSVLDRKDFLMRSFNSAVTEPVEDSSLSQQVLWHFGRFFFFLCLEQCSFHWFGDCSTFLRDFCTRELFLVVYHFHFFFILQIIYSGCF